MPKKAEIRKIERSDGRPKKWGVAVPTRPGKAPTRKFFETQKERDVYFNRLRRIEKADGMKVVQADAGDLQLLKQAREILPPDVSVLDAARFYVRENVCFEKRQLKVGIKEFEGYQQLASLSWEHIDHCQTTLKKLLVSLGDVSLETITSAEIEDFLRRLDLKDRTIANYHQYLTSFFKWAISRGFCQRNPLAGVKKPKVPESEPEFMTVSDAEKFFRKFAEMYPKEVPFLALNYFGGVRDSHLRRLERADLNFEEKGIRLRGQAHKTGRRFFVQGFPDNLWEWLELWRKSKTLPVVAKSTWGSRLAEVTDAAGVVRPRNAGRHSFCTHHVALFGSADKTATLLTHRGSVAMLYEHYRGNVTKKQAERYFQILPEKVRK